MSFPLPPQRRQRDTDYEVGELLGRGTYTSVYQATEIATGKSFALKIVDRYRCERLKKTKDLYMEKHCLMRTNHPNIVKMRSWFSDTASVFVVMEECLGGELWDVVKTVGCPDNVARHYLAQMVNGLEYLRQARMVHRDLKAENTMLTELGVVKIIDFGTAKDLENPHIEGAGNASRHKVFKDYVGTPQFMPQEVIENKCTDFRSDTWSLGCTIFQVLTGCPPFHGASEYLVFQRILAMDLQIPPGVNPQAKDLITRMVVKDPDARLGSRDLEEVRAHPYFAGVAFWDTHRRPRPVMSLADICLQKVGRQLKDFRGSLEAWPGRPALSAELGAALERMELSQKWQDDVMPPEESW
mmetsp:Transcript_107530/g.335244  ORF Transcript_107530/g.335244 Transcript_107530/m.335244 type:complete len:355 (-) Transcript_107530:94-1158(-)